MAEVVDVLNADTEWHVNAGSHRAETEGIITSVYPSSTIAS